jgi:uncharacterized membrane protein
MRRIWQFVKTTVLGGAIFLLPIAATLVIIVKAGKMAVDTATPLAEKLPFPKGQAAYEQGLRHATRLEYSNAK